MSAHHLFRRQGRSRGFTLVELMVAIMLGLFLMIGLISLIVSTVNSRSELDKSSRQIENGRYALQVLSEDIQLAGFLGATSSTSFALAAPVACPATLAELGYLAKAPSDTSNVPMPVYALSAVPDCIDHVMADTAMLVVTRVSTAIVATPASAVATETYLQVSNCSDDKRPNKLPFVLAVGAPAASFDLMQKDCLATRLAPLRRVVQHVYYVSTCNVCGSDTTPTLKRAEFVNGAMTIVPLVEGIENLQFDYGIDIDGNGSPDCYVSNPNLPPPEEIKATVCPQTTPPYDWTAAATNWANVMAVRIHVLARNTEASGGWTDKRSYDMGLEFPAFVSLDPQFKRHVYSTVARLYNASGQRETP